METDIPQHLKFETDQINKYLFPPLAMPQKGKRVMQYHSSITNQGEPGYCPRNYFFELTPRDTLLPDGSRVLELEMYLVAPGRGVSLAMHIERTAQFVSDLNQVNVMLLTGETNPNSFRLFSEKMENYMLLPREGFFKMFYPSQSL